MRGGGAASAATTFSLDFSNVTSNTQSGDGAFSVSYSGVGSDGTTNLNALLEVGSSYLEGAAPGNTGQVDGDIRINTARGSVFDATLTLFDAGAGTGFDTVYDPGQNFTWALVFLDIDTSKDGARAVETLTLNSGGTATVGANAGFPALAQSTLPSGGLFFDADGVGSVPNPTSNVLDSAQSNVSVQYNLSNTSVVNFTLGVETNLAPGTGGRNILIDGGNVTLTGTTTTTPVPIPLPAGLPLMLLGIGAFALARRAR